MKLIRQASLHFQEGRSDKVYEVDLCEVGDGQYVVNFRYGRRGATLRDGTKTTVPVSLEVAERLYNDLVDSKIDKGYHHQVADGAPDPADVNLASGAEVSAGGSTDDAKLSPPPPDPREQPILDRLARGVGSREKWKLSRAVWRAGELGLAAAEEPLLQLIGRGEPMLDYSIAAALARCGTANSIDGLRQIKANKKLPFHVRRMATEAIWQLMPADQRDEFIRKFAEQLPEPLRESALNGPAERFQELLLERLQSQQREEFTLEVIYFIDNSFVRPALLHLLKTVPLRPNYFLRLRRILKSAEIRRDAQVFGILAYRIETTLSEFSMPDDWTLRYRREKKPTLGANASKAFSRQTKFYLRRRSWRTLRRLGELESGDYVRLAVGVLLPFTDEDCLSGRTIHRWDYSSRRDVRHDVLGFHDYWAFCHILYHNSQRYRPMSGGKCFWATGHESAETPREEAFPQLWDKQPVALMHLLDESRCRPVHEFATRALRANPAFCAGLDLEALKMMLASVYEVTAELGLDLAVARYHADSPDRSLVLALANCVSEKGRQQAHQWISDQRRVFLEDIDFAAALLTSSFADTREFATEALRTIVFDDVQTQVLVARLVAHLQTLSDGDGEVARDIAAAMLRLFAVPLRSIGEEIIRDLLQHTLPEVQSFAGDLLLGHESLAAQPPADMLRNLIQSAEASV